MVRIPTLLLALTIGCGSDHPNNPDAAPPDSGNAPPPRVIAGGGIGDGPIDGVVNLYVIDDATRLPIAGAMVQVGATAGATDSTGLYVARGVVGAQTIVATASTYRPEMWIGANGANVTIDLHAAIDPTPASASLSGTIAGFDAIVLASGHHKTAIVAYSQTDDIGGPASSITTPNNTNICDVPATAGQACTFTVASRTGHVALLAAIYDHDPVANTFTLIGWASRTGITVQSGVAQSGQDLAMVPANSLANVAVDFGTPPSALGNVAAIVGVELNTSEGIMQLPVFVTPASSRVLAPKPSVWPGATLRVTGIATSGTSATAASSVVIARGLTGTTLAAGTWLAPPSGATITRTTASWTADAGALVQGVEWTLADGTHVLSATAFDGSTSITVPALVALPASGPLDATATALAGTLDLGNFALDLDKTKLTAASAQAVVVN